MTKQLWKSATFVDDLDNIIEKNMTEFLNKNNVKEFHIITNINNVSVTVIYR